MSRYMPYGGFRWYEGNPDVALAQLETMRETDDVGRVYEVDVSYPQSLHDAHNELPFLPYASVPKGSKVCKLMATLELKKKYVVHYVNLKQAIANGLIIDKVCHKRARALPLSRYNNINNRLCSVYRCIGFWSSANRRGWLNT
jgi:hypothetical protein